MLQGDKLLLAPHPNPVPPIDLQLVHTVDKKSGLPGPPPSPNSIVLHSLQGQEYHVTTTTDEEAKSWLREFQRVLLWRKRFLLSCRDLSVNAHIARPAPETPQLAEVVSSAAANDWVVLAPGTHAGGVVVNKPGVTLHGLKGSNREPCVVVGPPAGHTTVTCDAADVCLSNLELRHDNSGASCVRVSGGAAVVDSCSVVCPQGRAVQVVGQAAARIDNTIIPSPGVCGIHIASSGAVTVKDCEITDANVGPGILVNKGEPKIVTNKVLRSRRGGIVVSGKDTSALILGNQVEGSSQVGTAVTNKGRAVVEGNLIASNGHHGVAVLQGAQATLRNNNVANNALYGLAVQGQGSEVVVHSCAFDANRRSALRLFGASHCQLRNVAVKPQDVNCDPKANLLRVDEEAPPSD